MARTPKKTNGNGGEKTPPTGKEKLTDRLSRYAMYGQMYNDRGSNMTYGQRMGGAMFNALEQQTLGQMGMLGGAISAGIHSRKGPQNTKGGSGVDTQTIPFQQIKGDDVVSAVNQSTRQVVGGLNSLNSTMGRGFNSLRDGIQAQSQALRSIVAASEDTAIQMRELYEQLNKMAYNRGNNKAGSPTSMGAPSPTGSQNDRGILGDIAAGALLSLLGLDPTKNKPDAKNKKTPQPRDEKGRFKPRTPAAGPAAGTGGGIFSRVTGGLKNIASKAALPVFGVIAIWGAWEQISALDTKMEISKYRAEVAKIIGKVVGEFGLVLVGGIMGGIIAGAISGPGAIVGFAGGLAGGLVAQYTLGDSVDSIVDAIVSYLYEGKPQETAPASKNKSRAQAITNPYKPAVNATNVASAAPGAGFVGANLVDTGILGAGGRPDFLSSNIFDKTSESKLKAQEAIAEETAKKNITQSITINARDLLYKADKITFDTDTLEFKYNDVSIGESGSGDDGQGITPMSPATPGGGADNFGRPGGTEARDGSGIGPMPALSSLDGGKARENAEKYLGRKMSDQEYDYLIRATHAEAAAGTNADPREQAGIMASILNRARDMGDNGVIKALTAKNQFQAVTGTKFAPGPSKNFTQGPGQQRLQSVEDSSQLLSGFSRDQKNFTAASSGAYGPGTNITYRDNMIKAGGTTLGGSVFNTSPNFNSGSSTGGAGLQGPDASPAQPSSTGGSGLRGPDAPDDVSSTSSSGGGGSVIEQQSKVAGIRRQPISSKLKSVLQRAAAAAGVDAVVISGGQPAKGSGGPRTGSTRHDNGNAADLYLTRGGRKLSDTNSEDKAVMAKFVSAAVSAGATGVGAGHGYMGPSNIHVGFGKQATWGGASWIKSAASGVYNNQDLSSQGGGQFGGGGGHGSHSEGPTDASPVSSGFGGAGIGGGGGGGMGGASPLSSMMGALGGGGNPLSSMMGMIGGGSSPFGMIGSLVGAVLGGLSSSTSMTAQTAKGGPVTANIINNTKKDTDSTGTNFPDPKTPLPAIDTMFARLFDGSSMFG